MAVLLIDIGGTKCSFGFDDLEKVETLKTADFSHPLEILKNIADKVHASGYLVEAVAVSFGGQFDFDSQLVRRSVHKDGWEEFSFSDWAREEFGAPAIADNDANCGALSEWAAREKPLSLVYVTVSTGIGAGLVVNNFVHRGKSNLAGELGHIQIVPAGKPDELGNFGTLERYCGGYWIRKDFGKNPEVLFGDQAFFDEYCNNLAAGLRVALRLLAPDFLVLGGGITKVGSKLEESLKQNLALDLEISGTHLEISKIGEANVLLGARELARLELHI